MFPLYIFFLSPFIYKWITFVGHPSKLGGPSATSSVVLAHTESKNQASFLRLGSFSEGY